MSDVHCHASTLALAIACAGYYFGAGLAICIGYHRVLSHRSAVLSKGLERLFVTLGLPAGTPIQWAGNHRFHHAHADQPDDPHSPRDGFWHAHNGWYIGRKDALLVRAVRARRPAANPVRRRAPSAFEPAARPPGRPTSPPIPGTAGSAGPVRTSPSRSRTSSLFFGGAFWLFGWAASPPCG